MLGPLQIPFRVLEHFAVADVIEMRVRQYHCVDVGGLKTDLVKLSRNRSGNDAAALPRALRDGRGLFRNMACLARDDLATALRYSETRSNRR